MDEITVNITEVVDDVMISISEMGVPGKDADGDLWINYVLKYAPSTETEITGGIAIQYDGNGETVYRFIPEPYAYNSDAFYTTFDGVNVSGLIVTRI